ncbi:hypothetical protein PVW48_09430 [Dinoroseobacter sp. PD6]|uniref:hypothetical protein n=1 Tax=Dinoroseobacter sp. PD6 TaxID=3028384 RepID=UPI00237AD094|nr:hypothetical protein [Dinoroseobacter sp. PD6]MDD9716965.1 hypothetical protein [Dinoroseobacter sp. PD6]
MIRAALIAALLALTPPAAAQQGWGDLDGLLRAQLLPPQASLVGAFWLPDHADPGQARRALGIAFFEVANGGNSTNIATGYFLGTGAGWAFANPVSGLFGQGPRDVVYYDDRVELTTTMPNPGDPRCCPTGEARWSVNIATGTATRLR